jgi:hypothetical protein
VDSRAAFDAQAGWCERLGSPFNAFVCRTFAERLTAATPVERAVLEWPGDPSPTADSVPLRVCGALHALARSARHPALAELYRTFSQDAPELNRLLDGLLLDEEAVFSDYLSRPPQTNEVGRSAPVMAGLLSINAMFGLPLILFELGASAGLNLIPDLYAYEFGTARRGAASRLLLKPAWKGTSPPECDGLNVISRQGVDVDPIPLDSEVNRDRLVSYVWPDQAARLERLRTAIQLAAQAKVRVDQGDAAAWLQGRLRPHAGATSVVFHTIVWSYLSSATRAALTATMDRAGAEATDTAPLAWLRYELEPSMPAALRLKIWPGASDRWLAKGHPHGSEIEWMA